MIYSCKQDGCGYETKEEIQYCPKCGHNIIAIDDQKIKEEEEQKIQERIENDIIGNFNALVTNKETLKLLSNGWDIRKIEKNWKLTGIKNIKGRYSLADKTFVMVIFNGQIEKEKKIAEYSLEYLETAKKLGAESIIIMEKDYPCVAKLSDGRLMVIAPRVSD